MLEREDHRARLGRSVSHVSSDVSRLHLDQRVQRFLFEEAMLVDSWRLDEWMALFDEDGRYEVPSTETADLPAHGSQYLVSDDIVRLRARVKRLSSPNAHAERPRSRLQHVVSNVFATRTSAAVEANANVVVHRFRNGQADSYHARYRHLLREDSDGFKFVVRRAEIVQEALSPGGTLSFIL